MVKFLLVDDSNLMVSVLKNFIKKEWPDAEFVEAHNGQDGVDSFKSEKPDIVFMDILMPIKDGLSALQDIRALDTNSKVIMCTSLKEAQQEEKANQLGAKGYITKPFSGDEIIAKIKEVM